MKNAKLTLANLTVNSFVTDETRDIKGGGSMDSNYPWSWASEQDAAAAHQPWPHPPQRLFFNWGRRNIIDA